LKLLDTSVAVDHLRGYGPATALFEELVRSRESVVASELTRFELLADTRPGEHDALEKFFSVLDWVPVTEDITRRAGEYARAYRRSHSGIGVVYYLLAGTVATLGADLMTINIRHFPMFDDLRPPYEYGPPEQRRSGRTP
jgi:predicted nucleic acid-binding protein